MQKIKSAMCGSGKTLEVSLFDQDKANFTTCEVTRTGGVGVSVDKDELREVLSTEFNWTIMDNTSSNILASWERELLYGTVDEPENLTPETARSLAKHYAARAVELEAEQKKQEDALTAIISSSGKFFDARNMAKTLIQTGKVTVTE